MRRISGIRIRVRKMLFLLQLLTLTALSAPWALGQAHADSYMTTAGSFSASSYIGGADAAWTIVFSTNFDLSAGDPIRFNVSYMDPLTFTNIHPNFSASASDIKINGTPVGSDAVWNGQLYAITTPVDLPANENITLTIDHTTNLANGTYYLNEQVMAGTTPYWSGKSQSTTFTSPPVPTLALPARQANAGDTFDLPITLAKDASQSVTAIEFNLEFDYMFLSLDTSAVSAPVRIEPVAGREDLYRVLIGSSDNTELSGTLGSLRYTVSSGRGYQEQTGVSLTNIIVSDADGNTTSLADANSQITVTDTNAPTVTLTPSTTDPALSLTATVAADGTGSDIAAEKWLSGDQDLATVKASGTVFTGDSLPISSNGVYTVYVEDEAGNGAIATITVANLAKKGDANGDGDVDLLDWQKTANYILRKETPSDLSSFAADMNDDGTINVGDWVKIAKLIVGVG